MLEASSDELREAERRLSVSLPRAVDLAYSSLALSPALNAQDRFLHPSEFEVDDGLLVLRRENQNCARWGIAPGDADPDPVVQIDRGEGARVIDSGPVSSFFVFCALSEAVFVAPYAANAPVDPDPVPLELLEASYHELRIEPFQFWPNADLRCRLFGGVDTVVLDHAGTWLWAGCRTSKALSTLMAAVPAEWIIP